MKSSGVPAVLQRHILSHCFVAPAQLAVVTKHFLSGRVMFPLHNQRHKDITVKIYWNLKSIPELKDLSLRERGKRWRSAYKSAFRHWQTWCGLAVCRAFAGAGAYFAGIVGTVIFAGLGGFIYSQIVTHVVLKHYRHRLQGKAG